MELKDFTVLFLPTKGEFRRYNSFKILKNSSIVYLDFIVPGKGPFKYYVIKIVGGWVWPNAYVCLHSEWVGWVKCLRNQKNN